MAEVVLSGVSKRYTAGGALALRDVNLRVADGELVVIVGPSGCGKTTMLRLIAGLERSTSGDILIHGSTVNGVLPRERNVAMVFQDHALYPHMTAQQNIAFGLKMRGMSRDEIERRVRSAAGALRIGDLLPRKPGTLSGGERQRVALARAIARVPGAACLLFDEPLSNLDAHLRAAMRNEIRSVHQHSGATIIHVTHDQEEAMALGQRMVVMANGEVQHQGSPNDIYHHPRNRFVAGFIGSPAMNFIDGKLISEYGAMTFIENGAGGARVRVPDDVASRLRATPQEAVLGVRPEAVSIEREGASNGRVHGPTLHGAVRFVEAISDHTNVYAMTSAGSAVIARTRGHEPLSAGESVLLRIGPARVHLFSPGAFGENLLL